MNPAVLILAHKGIQNPHIWISWATNDPDHPINLYVANEDKSMTPLDGIELLDIPFVASQWGSKEIAINTMTALRKIVEEHPDHSIIFIVSGYCLPVQPSAFLYPKTHTVKKQHVDFDKCKTWNTHSITFPFLYEDKANALVSSIQWISLTPDSIRRLVDDPQLLETRPEGCSSPDEYYIQTLLKRTSLPVQDYTFMDICTVRMSDPSPIVWNLNENVVTEVAWGPRSTRFMTGLEFLAFAHQAGYAFARKFSTLNNCHDFDTFLEKVKSTQIPK